jgi:hypothetical protein
MEHFSPRKCHLLTLECGISKWCDGDNYPLLIWWYNRGVLLTVAHVNHPHSLLSYWWIYNEPCITHPPPLWRSVCTSPDWSHWHMGYVWLYPVCQMGVASFVSSVIWAWHPLSSSTHLLLVLLLTRHTLLCCQLKPYSEEFAVLDHTPKHY